MDGKELIALVITTVITTVLAEWTKYYLGTLPGQTPVFISTDPTR